MRLHEFALLIAMQNDNLMGKERTVVGKTWSRDGHIFKGIDIDMYFCYSHLCIRKPLNICH